MSVTSHTHTVSTRDVVSRHVSTEMTRIILCTKNWTGVRPVVAVSFMIYKMLQCTDVQREL